MKPHVFYLHGKIVHLYVCQEYGLYISKKSKWFIFRNSSVNIIGSSILVDIIIHTVIQSIFSSESISEELCVIQS